MTKQANKSPVETNNDSFRFLRTIVRLGMRALAVSGYSKRLKLVFSMLIKRKNQKMKNESKATALGDSAIFGSSKSLPDSISLISWSLIVRISLVTDQSDA